MSQLSSSSNGGMDWVHDNISTSLGSVLSPNESFVEAFFQDEAGWS
jgi:hypothetical protein